MRAVNFWVQSTVEGYIVEFATECHQSFVCRNLQGKFLRSNTKGHRLEISTPVFDVVKTLEEGNSPRPKPTRPLQAIY